MDFSHENTGIELSMQAGAAAQSQHGLMQAGAAAQSQHGLMQAGAALLQPGFAHAAESVMMPMMASGLQPAAVAGPPRLPKKVRDAQRKAAFYHKHFEVWGQDFLKAYLTYFLTDHLHLFYLDDSVFTSMDTTTKPTGIVNMQGPPAIYAFLSKYRGLKQVHLASQQVQPMSDHSGIKVIAEIYLEDKAGAMLHVMMTFVLNRLTKEHAKSGAPAITVGKAGSKSGVIRRQIDQHSACQYVRNQDFVVIQ